MTHLALIKDSGIVQTVTDGRGFNLPDGRRVSPAEASWPGVDGYTLEAIADADPIPDGQHSTGQSAQMVDGVPKWVHALEDVPPEPFRPIPRRDCFQIVLREFSLTRDTLRTMAGDFGALHAGDAGVTEEVGRESALIDFDEAKEFHHNNPLLVGVMTEAGLSPEQRDEKWRKWQAGLS